MSNLFENLQCIQKSLLHKNKSNIKKESNTKRTNLHRLIERSLRPDEYNFLKKCLNKNNTIKDIFILNPGRTNDINMSLGNGYHYNTSMPNKLRISIYGALVTHENLRANSENQRTDSFYGSYYNSNHYANTSKDGAGIKLYDIIINLYDESIEITDHTYSYDLKQYIQSYVADDPKFVNADNQTIVKLIDIINNIIEESKSEIIVGIQSRKNFIRGLTGKSNVDRDATQYNINLDENFKLTEDFDSSMPEWLKRAIRIMNQGTYSHKDTEFQYPLDTLKWNIIDTPTQGTLSKIQSLDDIVACLIDKSGDKHYGHYIVYCPDLYLGMDDVITINGRSRQINKISFTTLAPYIKEIAIAKNATNDLYSNRNKRNQRYYNKPDNKFTRYNDENKLNYSDELDKSGYIVDPNKYNKLLAKLHIEDYADQLNDLYIVLNDIKNLAKDTINNNMDSLFPDPKSMSTPSIYAQHTNELVNEFHSASNYYRYAIDSLEEIRSESTKFGKTGIDNFKRYVQNCNATVNGILNIIDKYNK